MNGILLAGFGAFCAIGLICTIVYGIAFVARLGIRAANRMVKR